MKLKPNLNAGIKNHDRFSSKKEVIEGQE